MRTSNRNNRGFRDQQLSSAPRASARLDNARAALLEAELAPKAPVSIIGGQFIGTDNDAAINAALNARDDRAAFAKSAAELTPTFGSKTVTRGTPGGLEGGTVLGDDPPPAAPAAGVEPPPAALVAGGAPAAAALVAGGAPPPVAAPAAGGAPPPAAPGMNSDPIYPGGPSIAGIVQSAGGTADPQSSGPDVQFGGGQFNVTQKTTPDFGIGNAEPSTRRPRRSAYAPGRSGGNTTLGDVFGPADDATPQGMRNGGMFTKQKMVKQPGYQGGGKVKMPVSVQDTLMAERRADPQWQAALKEAAATGYYQPDVNDPDADIAAVDRMMYDQNAPQREAEMQQMMQTREAPVAPPQGMRAPTGSPGYKWGPQAPVEPVRDGYRWDDAQGMRGYKCGGRVKRGMMAGGAIGDDGADDGKDSVEVRVREGEYLLNPPTVAAAFGGGDYDAGVETLDQIVRETTGQEPGPVPVNEEGEAVRQGMRNGGKVKLGYAYGGFVDDFGNLPSPENMTPAQRQFLNTGVPYPVEGRPHTRHGQLAMEGNTRAAQLEATEGVRRPPRRVNPEVGPPRETVRSGAAPKLSREQLAWNAEQARQNSAPRVAPQQGFRSTINTGGSPWNPQINMEGVKQTVQKYAPRAWEGTKKLGRGLVKSAPVASAVGETWGIGRVAMDEDSDIYDIFDQAGTAITSNAAGVLGGILGSRGGFRGAAATGAAGFMGARHALGNIRENRTGDRRTPYERLLAREEAAAADAAVSRQLAAQDQLIADSGYTREQFAAGEVPADVEAAIRTAMGQPVNTTEATPAAYGRAFGAGDVNLPSNGLRSAAEAVAPGSMNVVQNTGGPGEERIIREDINGVPTFTNVRQGGFRGDARTLQAEADARVAQDAQINARNAQVVQQMRDSAPVYTQEGVDQRRQEDLLMQQTAMEAASRGGSGSKEKAGALRRSLEERYQQDVYDADGNVKGTTTNRAQVDMVEKVISQLNPGFIDKYGMPFHELPEHIQQSLFTQHIDTVLRDTQIAKKAQKDQGYPTSNIPRTGDNSLRVIPGSDISFWGDAVFGDTTLGEWWAGAWPNTDPVNDRMVRDPKSGDDVRFPLSRLTSGVDDEQEALRRYRYDGGEQ